MRRKWRQINGINSEANCRYARCPRYQHHVPHTPREVAPPDAEASAHLPNPLVFHDDIMVADYADTVAQPPPAMSSTPGSARAKYADAAPLPAPPVRMTGNMPAMPLPNADDARYASMRTPL